MVVRNHDDAGGTRWKTHLCMTYSKNVHMSIPKASSKGICQIPTPEENVKIIFSTNHQVIIIVKTIRHTINRPSLNA